MDLTEENETDTKVICDIFAAMIDYADWVDGLADWKSDESLYIHLGWAVSLGDATLTESGNKWVRVAYIALLQALDMDSLSYVESVDDFVSEAGLHPLSDYMSGKVASDDRTA